MQRDYRYELIEPAGRNFDPDFKPDLTPAEMLCLGVFGGKRMAPEGMDTPGRSTRLVPMVLPLIIWGDECPTKTLGRSNAGKQSAVTSDSFSLRANLEICHAADGNVRRSCIGPTTAGNCKETSRSRALDDAWPEVLSPSPIAAAARWSTEASQPAQSLLAQRRRG